MNQPAHRPTQEHVRLLIEMNRSNNAQKATRISPSAMSEVLSALHDYSTAVEASDLGECSKNMYRTNAENFVRWMRNEFVPGSRVTPYRKNEADKK